MVCLPNEHTLALQAGVRFLAGKAWKKTKPSVLFCLKDIPTKTKYFASIMSCCGSGTGLVLAKGLKGFAVMHGLLFDEIQDDFFSTSCDMFILCIASTFNEVPKWARSYIRKNLGLVAIQKGHIPILMMRKAGKTPKPPIKSEAKVATRIIEAINYLIKEKSFRPPVYKKKNKLPLFLVTNASVTAGEDFAPKLVSLNPAPVELSREEIDSLVDVPKIDTEYFISYSLSPQNVRGKESSLFIIFDQLSGSLINGDVIWGRNLKKVVNIMIESFKGDNLIDRAGIPKQLLTDSQYFFEGASKTAKALKIPLFYHRDLPELQLLRKNYSSHLSSLRGLAKINSQFEETP